MWVELYATQVVGAPVCLWVFHLTYVHGTIVLQKTRKSAVGQLGIEDVGIAVHGWQHPCDRPRLSTIWSVDGATGEMIIGQRLLGRGAKLVRVCLLSAIGWLLGCLAWLVG